MATLSTSVSGVSPAGRIAASTYLRGLAAVERGDFDQALRQFRPACEFVFVSRTALGARLSGKADLLRWFERFRRLLADPLFDDQALDSERWVRQQAPEPLEPAPHVRLAG